MKVARERIHDIIGRSINLGVIGVQLQRESEVLRRESDALCAEGRSIRERMARATKKTPP